MKNKSLVFLLAATVLSGCGTLRPSIPVVDAGAPVTPGAMRDRDARQGTVVPEQRNEAPVAYGVPESQYVKPETGYAPSAPIQGEEFDAPLPAAESVYESAAPAPAPATPAPIATEQQQTSAVVTQIDPPVLALLSTAQQQQSQGDLNGAAASLERAQRIAPREPQVLYRLAEVRLAQGDAQQAEQIAQRGLSLSSGRPALQAGLWDLIAETRDKRGDAAGAAQARQRARISL